MTVPTQTRRSPCRSSRLDEAMKVFSISLEGGSLVFRNKGTRGTLTSAPDKVSLAWKHMCIIVTSDYPWVWVSKVSNTRPSSSPAQGNTSHAR